MACYKAYKENTVYNQIGALMKRIVLLTLFHVMCYADPIEMSGRQLFDLARREAMPLLLAITPDTDSELKKIAEILASDLQRSGQFKVKITSFEMPYTQTELVQLLDKAYPLEIFLAHADNNAAIEWRLYDVHDGTLIKGMKYYKRGKMIHGFADNLADMLWPVLTKQSSSFSSKLAYVKRKKTTTKRQRSVICVSHTDGSREQEIIRKPGTYVSLYWHHDTNFPCLFCSEFTRFNVRLIRVNLKGKKNVVLNLPGTCVGISLTHDNNKAVYCRSGTIWSYAYDGVQKKGIHKPLIKNDGKNVSPTLLENGDIIFCSDSKKLRQVYPKASGPQICRYHAATNSIALLTQEGYCVGPSYCPQNHKVAYSKRVNGTMQLFVYDCRTKEQQQVTFDKGNKIDCCWSPCGNFIVYCYQIDAESRIAMMHVVMRKRSFITPENEYCTCPSWSPVYKTVPTIG